MSDTSFVVLSCMSVVEPPAGWISRTDDAFVSLTSLWYPVDMADMFGRMEEGGEGRRVVWMAQGVLLEVVLS